VDHATLVLSEADGDRVLANTAPPPASPPVVHAWLSEWAARAPDRPLVVETAPGAPDRPHAILRYGDAAREARRLASALSRVAGPAGRPIVIALPPGIEHLRVMLACMVEGRAAVPVAPRLARAPDADRDELLAALRPGAVVVEHGERDGALGARLGAPVIAARGATTGQASLADLARAAEPVPPPRVPPKTVAKLLLTSGSTGPPKAVEQTHRMLTVNQAMLAAVLPELVETPPVLVDWLPWSHTFGGNHDLHLVLAHGGTLVIDEGPGPDPACERRLARLAAFAPTAVFDVPRVYDRLVEVWQRRPDLARRCLARARVVFFAGAALTPDTHGRLTRIVARFGPAGAFVSCGYGATETGPLVTAVPRCLARRTTSPACVGVPAPGARVRLARRPQGVELWVQSPAVAPAYRDATGTRRPVTDGDGWLHTGDEGRLCDDDDPTAGIALSGRLAENFKLGTGTFVPVASVRAALHDALRPHAAGIVLAAPNAPFLSAIVFPAPATRAALAAGGAPARNVLRQVQAALGDLARRAGGSSRCVVAVALLHRAPDPAAGEITDKGYLCAARVRARCEAALSAIDRGTDCDGASIVRIDHEPQSST